jgi:hypothetical protein
VEPDAAQPQPERVEVDGGDRLVGHERDANEQAKQRTVGGRDAAEDE